MEISRWGVGGVLHSEFDVGGWVALVGFGDGGGGGRGYGEAACFGDGGDEGVEPLAGEELEIWLEAEGGLVSDVDVDVNDQRTLMVWFGSVGERRRTRVVALISRMCVMVTGSM